MNIGFFIKIIVFFLISAFITLTLTVVFGTPLLCGKEVATDGKDTYFTSADTTIQKYTTVIIDAGHGGEDGGASSTSGLVEKDVNLEIALILRDMLRANGINVVMTREDDRLLYDKNANYQGRKKKLDLAARLAVTENTPNAIFVSIHMNSFPDSKYSGLQVWYSPNNTDSSPLAELIRTNNREMLQTDNERKCKSATSAINLLHNAKCPAVLVECGFLSNSEEAMRFETYEYRQRVAFMLFCSINEFLNHD